MARLIGANAVVTWPEARLFEAIPDMQSLGIEAFLDKWEHR
jgi:hypothetical protein